MTIWESCASLVCVERAIEFIFFFSPYMLQKICVSLREVISRNWCEIRRLRTFPEFSAVLVYTSLSSPHLSLLRSFEYVLRRFALEVVYSVFSHCLRWF